MDIGSILGAVASGASGGLFGGVLGLGQLWLKGRQERDRLKLEQEHDREMARLEMERARVEANIDLEKTDLAALGETVRAQDAEIRAMTPALEGAWRWLRSVVAGLFALVTVVQKTIRPALTVALVVFTWNIYHQVNAMLGGVVNLPAAEVLEIYRYVLYSVLSLTGTAVAFWFTTRFQGARK